MTDLSVVVLNWNQAAVTRRCLERLRAWSRVRPELWVVDNASQENPVETLQREIPEARWIRNKRNRGFAGGNNLALRRIDRRYVLLLNGDATLTEEDSLRLVAALARHPDLLAVGPLVVQRWARGDTVTAGGRDIARYPGTHRVFDESAAQRRSKDGLLDVDYLPGSAVVLRRAEVARLGYFDEDYFFGGEMADLCERARRAGLGCAVLPEARAEHDMEEAAERRASLYPYYILRNRFLFIRKHRRRARFPLGLFWTLYGLAALGRELLRGDRVRARLFGLALADGLRGRWGNANRRVLGRDGAES